MKEQHGLERRQQQFALSDMGAARERIHRKTTSSYNKNLANIVGGSSRLVYHIMHSMPVPVLTSSPLSTQDH